MWCHPTSGRIHVKLLQQNYVQAAQELEFLTAAQEQGLDAYPLFLASVLSWKKDGDESKAVCALFCFLTEICDFFMSQLFFVVK